MYCRPGALTGRLFNRPPAHVFPERLLLNSILRHPHDSCKSAPCRGSTSNPGRSHFGLFAPSPPRTGRGQGRGVDLVRPRSIPSPPRLPSSASDGEKVAEGQMRCPGRVGRGRGWANHCYRPPLHQPEARRRRRRRNTDPAPNTDRINCFPMKLTKVHVREFKSIRDSNPFEIGNVTCLVGKNEAGKTAILEALYRLNPIIPEHAKFEVTEDYPR